LEGNFYVVILLRVGLMMFDGNFMMESCWVDEIVELRWKRGGVRCGVRKG
jgi:hypothetical protein